MKNIGKFATLALMLVVMAAFAVAQDRASTGTEPRVSTRTTTVLSNLTEGAPAVPGNGSDWEGWSEIDYIPGASLFGVTTKDSYFTLGFSGGSTVDINSMVLYTTARGSNVVTKVTKLTYLSKANPSINLTSTSNCPVQPVSAANPCFIKLTKAAIELIPTNDYYFAIYFTSDSNNNSMRGAGSTSDQAGAITSWQIDGSDGLIPVGGTVPVGDGGGAPLFLMYLTNE
jgi:hypothetical protein